MIGTLPSYKWPCLTIAMATLGLLACNQSGANRAGATVKASGNLKHVLFKTGGTCSRLLADTKGNLLLAGTSNIYNCGTNSGFPDNPDALVIKLKPDGSLLQATSYGTTDKPESVERMLATKDGGCLLLVQQKNNATNDLVLVKASSDGQVEWSFSSDRCDASKPCFAVQLPDMGFLVAARNYDEDNFAKYGINLLRLDASGNLLWARNLEMMESCFSMTNTADGGILLVTKQKGTYITPSEGNVKFDCVPVTKLNQAGDILWSQNLVLVHTPNSDLFIHQALECNGGDICLLGYTKNDLTPHKAMSAIMVSGDGNTVKWGKRFDVPQDAEFKTGLVDEKGNIVAWADGYGSGDQFYALKFDPSGILQSAKSVKMNSLFRINDLVKTDDSYWLGWDNLLNFAVSGTDASGGFPEPGVTVKPAESVIPAKIRTSSWQLQTKSMTLSPFSIKRETHQPEVKPGIN